MLELLNKYYDYIKKLNSLNIDEDEKLFSFYKMIINQYDLSTNPALKNDIDTFFSLYDFKSDNGIIPSEFSKYSKKDREKEFAKRNCSFTYFKPTNYIRRNEYFLYSVPGFNGVYCKAYLSIKPEKYVEVMKKIQDFIDYLYTVLYITPMGECKFRNVPANDSIVMRFVYKIHYNAFLNFLDQNPDIMASYDIRNPFLPIDSHGLSIIYDRGGSYNNFVTIMLWEYLNKCNGKISLNELVDFINMYDTSKNSMLCKENQVTINFYKEILTGMILSKNNDELVDLILGNGQSRKLKRN